MSIPGVELVVQGAGTHNAYQVGGEEGEDNDCSSEVGGEMEEVRTTTRERMNS